MPLALAMGIGATLLIDTWALLLRRAFGVRSLDFCLLGRWVLLMAQGRLVHHSIGAASRQPHECAAGWTAHYLIGASFGVIFVCIAPTRWTAHPTLLPALAFGMATVVVPFCTMQPAMGLGFASSKTAEPNKARIRSVMTHTVFGVGLWACYSTVTLFARFRG
jgi:hypothetical protein